MALDYEHFKYTVNQCFALSLLRAMRAATITVMLGNLSAYTVISDVMLEI